MAQAPTMEAPTKVSSKDAKKWPVETAFLEQEFEPGKKYMFELAEQNIPRHHPVIDMHQMKPIAHKPFIPYRNLIYTSQIIWKGQRRGIRYYDGCDSIFMDEQPKEKETIQSFMAQTRLRVFVDGKLGITGDERMLLLFMFAASFNGESPFRTSTADVIYIPTNSEKKFKLDEQRLDFIEQALELAKNASEQKMYIHADYLGIPMKDFDSDNDLTEKEIRTAYRLEASRDAKRFVESYGNKTLELKYFLKKAVLGGLIDTVTNPNQAVWKSSGRLICDISGLKSYAAISDRLIEFSQTEDGEEFKIQLTALYNQ